MTFRAHASWFYRYQTLVTVVRKDLYFSLEQKSLNILCRRYADFIHHPHSTQKLAKSHFNFISKTKYDFNLEVWSTSIFFLMIGTYSLKLYMYEKYLKIQKICKVQISEIEDMHCFLHPEINLLIMLDSYFVYTFSQNNYIKPYIKIFLIIH